MSFFVGKLCSCGFIVELCCLAEITLKTIHRWPYLAGPRSLLVPLLCPNVFIWLNVPLLISVIVFSHLDTIKDYVMLCYVMLCYVCMLCMHVCVCIYLSDMHVYMCLVCLMCLCISICLSLSLCLSLSICLSLSLSLLTPTVNTFSNALTINTLNFEV